MGAGRAEPVSEHTTQSARVRAVRLLTTVRGVPFTGAIDKWQRYIHVTKRSFGTNDAVGTQRRLGTTPIVDGGTQWMSLSAAIDNRSNREPYLCTYSIVQLAP